MEDFTAIGWTPVDEAGNVHQSTVSNAYQNMFRKDKDTPTRKSVKKIYATEGKAAQYSPIGKAEQVFLKPRA